jgi:hypothetical protein
MNPISLIVLITSAVLALVFAGMAFDALLTLTFGVYAT